MALEHALFQEIVGFLTTAYGFENEAARRATLLSAGLSSIIPLLDLSGEPKKCIPLLLERLDQHGMVDGVPALARLLEAVKPNVGEEKQETLERFCQRLRRSHNSPRNHEPFAAPPNGNAAAPAAWDMFICYAREDLPTATRLHDELARAGIAAWLDKKRLIGGQNWKIEVKKAMRRSRCILALLSSHSVSKIGYAQKELREALEMLEHLPPDRILIIPVRLDECEPAHEQLRDLHWIDLFESYDEGLAKIVQAFRFSAETGGETPPLQNVTIDLSGGVTLDLVAIQGGTFWMGSPEGVGEKNEHPRHQVTLAPFLMGKYPVTQAQWQAVMGNNPSKFKGADRPVEQVSWNDCQEFVKTLNANPSYSPLNQGGQRGVFRLPTEAEWEYACRAGSDTIWHFGNDPTQLGKYAWFSDNSGGETHPVGQKSPNAFGLYDMHGNVWEWCADTWHENYTGAPTDGGAWLVSGGSNRVLRGGSWNYAPRNVRSANRNYNGPAYRYDDFGFRVARTI